LFLFGVYDGHVGPECGDVLRTFLPKYISYHLSQKSSDGVFKNTAKGSNLFKDILKQSFVAMDNDLIHSALNEKYGFDLNLIKNAFTGAVTLVTCIFDDNIFVANSGDVRALIGSIGDDGKMMPILLSNDHDMENPNERRRIISEHPGDNEKELTRNQRVLGGLQPTRSFGDANYKYSFEDYQRLAYGIKSKGPSHQMSPFLDTLRIPQNYKSPPYVTAEPDITHHKINTQKDKFIVIASDGLWERLTNEQVVQNMEEFLSNYCQKNSDPSPPNAATFLMKKALESSEVGRDPQSRNVFKNIYNLYRDRWLEYLISIPHPYSRRIRDDITITVIFLEGSCNSAKNVSSKAKIIELQKEFIRYPNFSSKSDQQHMSRKEKRDAKL